MKRYRSGAKCGTHDIGSQLSEHLPFLSIVEMELLEAAFATIEKLFLAGVIVGLTLLSLPDPAEPALWEGVDGVPLAPAPALSVAFSIFGWACLCTVTVFQYSI